MGPSQSKPPGPSMAELNKLLRDVKFSIYQLKKEWYVSKWNKEIFEGQNDLHCLDCFRTPILVGYSWDENRSTSTITNVGEDYRRVCCCNLSGFNRAGALFKYDGSKKVFDATGMFGTAGAELGLQGLPNEPNGTKNGTYCCPSACCTNKGEQKCAGVLSGFLAALPFLYLVLKGTATLDSVKLWACFGVWGCHFKFIVPLLILGLVALFFGIWFSACEVCGDKTASYEGSFSGKTPVVSWAKGWTDVDEIRDDIVDWQTQRNSRSPFNYGHWDQKVKTMGTQSCGFCNRACFFWCNVNCPGFDLPFFFTLAIFTFSSLILGYVRIVFLQSYISSIYGMLGRAIQEDQKLGHNDAALDHALKRTLNDQREHCQASSLMRLRHMESTVRVWYKKMVDEGKIRSRATAGAAMRGGASGENKEVEQVYRAFLAEDWREITGKIEDIMYPQGKARKEEVQEAEEGKGSDGRPTPSAPPAPGSDGRPKPSAPPEPTVAEPTVPDTPAKDKEEVCCVCLDAPPTEIFQPCGHYAVCKECGDNLTQCPLCRAPIQKRMQAE